MPASTLSGLFAGPSEFRSGATTLTPLILPHRRFTVPEELFGPLSLHALEEDCLSWLHSMHCPRLGSPTRRPPSCPAKGKEPASEPASARVWGRLGPSCRRMSSAARPRVTSPSAMWPSSMRSSRPNTGRIEGDVQPFGPGSTRDADEDIQDHSAACTGSKWLSL